MPSEYHTISEQMLDTKVSLDNATSDPDIKQALAPFNYDDNRMAQGRTLYDNAAALIAKQKKEFGEQIEATGDLEAKWAAAKTPYAIAHKVSKIAFKDDPGALKKLMVDGKRKQSLSGWLEQAGVFYTNLLADESLIAKMATFGYNRKKLENEAMQVKAVADANSKQEAEKGDEVRATRLRDQALDQLDEWMSDFMKIANIALDGQEGLKKKLGIYKKTSREDEDEEIELEHPAA